MHDSESIAQRRTEHACAGGRADEREALERQLQRLGVRTAVDDEIDLKIFHRRIEVLFDRGPEAMDLVDEEHVARFQRGQNADQILGLLQRRTRSRPKRAAGRARDQVRQRRLAETRRTREEDVLERLAAARRRIDRDAQVVDDLLLADVVGESAWTQCGTVDFVLERGVDADDARVVGTFRNVLRVADDLLAYGVAHVAAIAA